MKNFLPKMFKISMLGLILQTVFWETSFAEPTSFFQTQPLTVTGTVTDEINEALPGVNVIEKGTTNGTITNLEGKFNLSVNPGATLVFSSVGYLTQEVPVNNKSEINLSMEVDVQQLDEIVVVGYGTQEKENLTGAVDVIDNERLKNRQASTVSQALQGLAPGLNFSIDNLEGFQPGASMDINIRGMGSLNGGQPYVVIDGFPGNINNLNPEDIESVSVLKDAAASAIFGARAPYGVIMVTTKQGKKNEKISVSYTGNVMMNIPQPLPNKLDSYTYARAFNEAGDNRGGRVFNNETIDRIIAYQNQDWDYLEQSLADVWPEGATIYGAHPKGNSWDGANLNYANNDWLDIYYGNSISQKHDLSLQGGGDKVSYYFSSGYLQQNGVLNFGTDQYERINITGKVDLDITDWWSFTWAPRFSRVVREKPHLNGQGPYSRVFTRISRVSSIVPQYDGYGTYMSTSIIPLMEAGSNKYYQSEFWNNFKTELRPAEGWKINVDFAYQDLSGNHFNVAPYAYQTNVDKTVTPIGLSVPNNIERINDINDYWTVNLYSSYEFDINDNHNFTFLAGTQFEKGRNTRLRGYKTDLIVEDVPSLQTATGTSVLSENLSHNATEGYFFRFNYIYKDRYLLESNARYDGSYVFREGNRWGFFPSFSAGWNIHNEHFWDNMESYVNALKIRGSWGQLGNQNVAPYSDIALIPLHTDQLNWIFGYGQPRPTSYTSAPGIVNRNLTWETATTTNLGLDMAFLDNRLGVNVDFFERLTTNMVGPSEAVPGVLGASVPKDNNATLRTRGWEVSINWRQNYTNGFSYFINANMADYKSVVTEYYNSTGILSTWYEGQEVGEIWGYTVHDLYRTQEDVDNHVSSVDLSFISTTPWRTGDVKYEDINGDGAVNNGSNTLDDHGDLSIIGNTSPRYQFGFSAGLNYKGFDFSMLWSGVLKRNFYFNSASNLFWGWGPDSKWWEESLTYEHLDYFRDQPGTEYVGLHEGEANINTDAYWPRPYRNPEMRKNTYFANTRYLQNASYIRLQNIQVGYTLPRHVMEKIKLQKARVYFSGENLLTFTSLPVGVDPVAPRAYGYGNYDGLGRLTYGADRIFSVGLTLTY